jgi:toxin YxiD
MSDIQEVHDVEKETIPKSTESLSNEGISAMQGDAPRVARRDVKGSEFDITDWSGYPEGPKPEGPFRLLEGDEYKNERKEADKANRKIHEDDSTTRCMDIHEIKPVKFGGDPNDLDNKIALTPEDHMEYTKFWNRKQKEIESRKDKG